MILHILKQYALRLWPMRVVQSRSTVDSECASNQAEQLLVDIGEIYCTCPTSESFCERIQTLTSAQKYHLLKHHKRPKEGYSFPTIFIGGCNRSFRPKWLSEHPWMVYSEATDGVFCIACALFSADPSKGKFVTQPFCTWNKKGKKADAHEHCSYHQRALEQADYLKQLVEKPQHTISVLVDTRRAANIERIRRILKSIASAMILF